jgi:hypothetical protein
MPKDLTFTPLAEEANKGHKQLVEYVMELADQIEEELKELREGGLNGAGTVFASLAQVARFHKSDMNKVEREFERTIIRLRKSANLPDKWRDVREALENYDD